MKKIISISIIIILLIGVHQKVSYAYNRNRKARRSAYKRHPKPVVPPRKVVVTQKKVVPVVPGDINHDGVVNQKDQAIRNRIYKQHTYVVNYDLNKDGVIDYRDKIIWINSNPQVTKTIVLTDQDNEMLTDIDVNEDGQIDQTDINIWFSNYDTNRDGQISETEFGS